MENINEIEELIESLNVKAGDIHYLGVTPETNEHLWLAATKDSKLSKQHKIHIIADLDKTAGRKSANSLVRGGNIFGKSRIITNNPRQKLEEADMENINETPAQRMLDAIINDRPSDVMPAFQEAITPYINNVLQLKKVEVAASVFGEAEELNEETNSEIAKDAHEGKDIGKPGKNFKKVAAKAAKEYGSEEAGERVAAAAMWKNARK